MRPLEKTWHERMRLQQLNDTNAERSRLFHATISASAVRLNQLINDAAANVDGVDDVDDYGYDALHAALDHYHIYWDEEDEKYKIDYERGPLYISPMHNRQPHPKGREKKDDICVPETQPQYSNARKDDGQDDDDDQEDDQDDDQEDDDQEDDDDDDGQRGGFPFRKDDEVVRRPKGKGKGKAKGKAKGRSRDNSRGRTTAGADNSRAGTTAGAGQKKGKGKGEGRAQKGNPIYPYDDSFAVAV